MGLIGSFFKAVGAAASVIFPPAAPIAAAVAAISTAKTAANVVRKIVGSDSSYDYEYERRQRERREREEREFRERQERERRDEQRRREERERWEHEQRERERQERQRREQEYQRKLEEERKRRAEEERQRQEALRQIREAQLREEARAREIEEMNSMVRQYRQSFQTMAASIERKSQQCIDIVFDGLMQSLCKDERLANSYGVKRLERQHDDIRRRVEGRILNRINLRITLDDEDCAAIFRTPKEMGDKAQMMNEFGNKIIAEAKEELAQFVAQTLRQQAEDVTESVQTYLDDQERKTLEAQNKYAAWEREKSDNSFDVEKEQLPARVKLHAIDCVEMRLAEKISRAA